MWDDATTFERINDLKPGSFLTLDREWGANPPTEISLTVPMPVRLREGINGAVSIQRGPVIYALQIEPEWKMFKDRAGLPFDDWEVFPKTPWNYALEIDREHPERSITFEPRKPSGPLFTAAGAPLRPRSKAGVCRTGSWKRSRCSTPKKPGRQPGAARGADAGAVRIDRSESERVSNLGLSLSDSMPDAPDSSRPLFPLVLDRLEVDRDSWVSWSRSTEPR